MNKILIRLCLLLVIVICFVGQFFVGRTIVATYIATIGLVDNIIATTPPASRTDSNSDQVFCISNTSTTLPRKLEWVVPVFQTIFRKQREDSTPAASALTPTIDCLVQPRWLEHANVPYFVYPQHVLFSDRRYYLENFTSNLLDEAPSILPEHHRVDAIYKNDILNALMLHSTRVYHEHEAQLFVLPIPMSTIHYDGGAKFECARKRALWSEISTNLQRQDPFRQGQPHVLVSMTSQLFSCFVDVPTRRQGLLTFYRQLASVSVARADDFYATRYTANLNVTSARGFDDHFPVLRPVTQYTFSVGLGGQTKHIPLRVPTWETFQSSTYFIFYHTRTTPFSCDSTSYRLAPVVNVSWSILPRSSVGFDLLFGAWVRHFTDSKFCLVFRGDTPHSHALFNAVKAGCIPVVISDWYLVYAPPFPTTLNMWDFCIFISEEDFMNNPQKALHSLKDLPDNVITSKLKALKWAQTVILLDHPQSLFVPAFIRETLASFSRPVSQITRQDEGIICGETCV